MTTRRRRLFGATTAVALVAALPFVAALGTMRLAERPGTALDPVAGLPAPVEPGPGCIARGSARSGAPGGSGPIVPAGARVTSSVVLRCPAAMDGAWVTYVGEVVGDVLRRRDGAWVLLNDDAYALSIGPLPAHATLAGTNTGLPVWLPEAFLGELSEPGRPGRRGDVVAVTGRVVRVDPEDAGGLTLRADALRVVAPGVDVGEPLDVPRLVLAVTLLVLAAVVRRRRRST